MSDLPNAERIEDCIATLRAANDAADHQIPDLIRRKRADAAMLALILEALTEKLHDLKPAEYKQVAQEASALHEYLLDVMREEEERQILEYQDFHRKEQRRKDELAE